MKTVIKKCSASVLAVVLVMSMLIPTAMFTASAASVADRLGGSTVASQTVTNGLTYEKVTFTKSSKGQTAYVMEFNPETSGLMPMGYQSWVGGHALTSESIADAKAAGYTVYAGINGEFFSPHGYDNAGTLTGKLVTNGRIMTDHETCNDTCFAVDHDGKLQIVNDTEIAYRFFIEGKEQLQWNGMAAIARINKRYHGTWQYDPICYFDSGCGSKTDTISAHPGVEVVFNKTDDTELTPEGVLQGEVVSVNTNTYGTSFGENQFVLYAHNASAFNATLSALTVGQKVQIYADVVNEASEAAMKNAVTISSATYPIVVNGVDNTDYTPNASDIYLTRAQRTALGVKPDGTYVFFCSDGRGTSAANTAGVTLPELAAIMIDLGCTTAFNLDGGGSSQMVVGDSTVFTYGREVGSSILIVGREGQATSSTAKQNLNDWIYNAKTSTYPDVSVKADVDAAVTEAEAIYADSKAMTADFVRETMDLKMAMGAVTSIAPKKYISLEAKDWSYNTSIMQATNDSDGNLIFNNTNGQWPSAAYSCAVPVASSDKLYFDITIAGQSSVLMTVNGQSVNLNSLIAPNSLDAGSGDIRGNGQTFKGAIDADAILSGGFDVTSVTIFAVGGAGDPSKVTVRELEFRNPFSGGDVNGSGEIDSSDARLIMRHIVGAQTLTDVQKAAADVNGDGAIDTNDVRQILAIRVGLA